MYIPFCIPLLLLFLLLRLALGPFRLLWWLAGKTRGGRLILSLTYLLAFLYQEHAREPLA